MANIWHVDRNANKITLGTTDTTINIASHTASKILALDASKELEVVTIGTSLDYTRPTLNTVQDIRTTASPEFASIELGHADDTTITRVGAGVIAVEGTTVMLVGDAPTSHTHDDRYYTETEIGDNYQPLDDELTSLAGLSYVAASFVKMTGANTFALRTLQETSDDLEATIDHDNLLNFTSNEHYLQSAITTVGTIASGTWQGTTIAINQGGTSQTTAQAAINALSDVSGGTDEHVLTKDTGTGNAIWKAAVGGGVTDHDALNNLAFASAGHTGFQASHANLAAIAGGTWTGANSITTLGTIATVGNITIADGGTIGQSAGPLVRFDNTNDYLEITGCKIGFGESTPGRLLSLKDASAPKIRCKWTDTDGVGGIELYESATFAGGFESFGSAHATYPNAIMFTNAINNNGKIQFRTRTSGSYKIRVIIENAGGLKLLEQASADGDTTAYGQIWVKNTDPCELWFTDDVGTDTKVVPSFGSWVDRSNNTSYQATTDGFVLAYSDDLSSGNVVGLTDGDDPPTTTRIHSKSTNVIDAGNSIASITMPVKRGDFWKVTGATTVTWMPIGTT